MGRRKEHRSPIIKVLSVVQRHFSAPNCAAVEVKAEPLHGNRVINWKLGNSLKDGCQGRF